MDEIENLLDAYVCAVRVAKASAIDTASCGTSLDYSRWRDAQKAEATARSTLMRALRKACR